MARRAPKNPINDISNLVSGWLGGRGPGTNPQVQAAMNATRAVGKVVDTATGGFGQALVSDAQRMAQTGSSTPSALYKTAAVNLGAAVAGAGAAKVAGKAVSKVVESGVAARVVNKLTGQTVFVHGSPMPNLSKLETYAGSRALPNEKVVYGWDPSSNNAQNWLTKSSVTIRNARDSNAASVYIAKAPTANVKNRAADVNWNVVTSSTPAKVVKELPIPSNLGEEYSQTFQQFDKKVLDAAKRAGAKFPKTPKKVKKSNVERGTM